MQHVARKANGNFAAWPPRRPGFADNAQPTPRQVFLLDPDAREVAVCPRKNFLEKSRAALEFVKWTAR